MSSDGPITEMPEDRHRGHHTAVDYSGLVDGRPAGIAILDDPRNPRSPSPWYVIRSAEMSFFSPAVLCDEPITLEAGERLTLRYRVIVHQGRWDSVRLKAEHAEYDARRVTRSEGGGSMSQWKNRRRFLKSAVAAAAAPMIVPSSVFGRTAPSNRVNLAAIGLGGRGSGNVWHDFVTTQDDVRLVAACDCFASRRTEFAARVDEHYGGTYCQPMADWREVLARDDMDGVIVSTPDHWHVPLAYHAAEAKKDMYVEKPLGVSMAWAWSCGRRWPATAWSSSTAPSSAPRASSRRAVELVRNGYIGKINHVDAWCSGHEDSGRLCTVFEERFGDTEPAPCPRTWTTTGGSAPRP